MITENAHLNCSLGREDCNVDFFRCDSLAVMPYGNTYRREYVNMMLSRDVCAPEFLISDTASNRIFYRLISK